jgi:hypothetical protein
MRIVNVMMRIVVSDDTKLEALLHLIPDLLRQERHGTILDAEVTSIEEETIAEALKGKS